jgi:RHS repeat-associated protein
LFDPWGKVRSGTLTTTTTLNYTGQKLDATGLLFYNARYYDPNIAKFISADTIIPNDNYPQSYNRYSYVDNKPLNYVDPSGHCKRDKDTGEEDWVNDSRCWVAWNLVKGHNNFFTNVDLSNWNASELEEVLNWLNRGIIIADYYTSSTEVLGIRLHLTVGGPHVWNSKAVGALMYGLRLVDQAFAKKGLDLDAALGIGAYGTLEFVMADACALNVQKCTDFAGGFNAGEKRIQFNAYWWSNSDASVEQLGNNAIHEMAHLIDNRLAGGGAAMFTSSVYWSGAIADRGGAWTQYALDSPLEDFAETFVWWVNDTARPGNPINYFGTRLRSQPDKARQDALNVALSAFKMAT